MFFRQLYDEGLAQASYIVGCERCGEALVVDPRRDIDIYPRIARAHGMRISAVAETHIHADYLSGGRELAAAANAVLHVSGHGDEHDGYLPRQEGVQVRLVREGDVLAVGDVRVRVRHTPGHTPEHICFEIFERADGVEPMIMLSGDFFFVGDLGRPDLLERALGKTGTALSSARAMFGSLRSALRDVPDFVTLWPAHGAGSACGKALGAVPSTTLGYERRFSWWSGYARRGDEEGFVAALLAGQPDAPAYFARMKHDNRGFTRLIHELPNPPALDAPALKAQLRNGAVLIDTRPREQFCREHVAGALSIADKASFSARSAWFVAPQQPIVLLASPQRVGDLVRRLVRVGLDNIVGHIRDVASAGLPTASLAQVTPQEARSRWADGATLVDVRQLSEFSEGHIPSTEHVSAASIVSHLDELPRDRQLVVLCAGGDRSVAVASYLCAAGFEDVVNMRGGFDEWRSLGLPAEENKLEV